MGWEKRSGRSFYYRKSREGRRVRSKYVGGGRFAQICADNDNDERRSRTAERATHNAMRRAETQIDRELADAELVLAAMTHATFSAAGYHKHKGQWRKKRRETKK